MGQVLGRKRVFLWPPADHPSLYPYPHIHPSYQQSQVNFDDPDRLLFPDFSHSAPLEMVLEPGDVAYLPPYWWHRIETLDDFCVFLDFWSMFQQPQGVQRTPAQQTAFDHALSSMDIWYGHTKNTTFCIVRTQT